jgi:hypothetical protein
MLSTQLLRILRTYWRLARLVVTIVNRLTRCPQTTSCSITSVRFLGGTLADMYSRPPLSRATMVAELIMPRSATM